MESMTSNADFFLASYHFVLPEENIAQHPLACRDSSRLLVVDCLDSETRDRQFTDICDYLAPGDLLVVNKNENRGQVLKSKFFCVLIEPLAKCCIVLRRAQHERKKLLWEP